VQCVSCPEVVENSHITGGTECQQNEKLVVGPSSSIYSVLWS